MMENILSTLKVCHIVWHTFILETRIELILFAVIVLVSCTKEIPIVFNEEDKQLVVNSIFSPNRPFSFNFSYTASPLSDYDTILLSDFRFILFENGEAILDSNLVSHDLNTSIYPKPNTSYSLELWSKNNPALIANDIIPQLVKIDEARLIFPAGLDKYGEYCAHAEITFTDPPNQKNYYELFIFRGSEGNNYWNGTNDVQNHDPVLINEGDLDYFPETFFFSDELFDGEKYTITIVEGGFSYPNGSMDSHTAVLRSVSESYYEYRKYSTRHFYNQQFQGDFLDLIFRGVPQTLYTNVINGYGIFAGYQETSRTPMQYN